MRRFGIRDASSARISAVPSVDWSFTTMTSPISGCAATDSTARAIDASSFRAGITAETIRGYSRLPYPVFTPARSAVEGNRAPTPSVGNGGEAGLPQAGNLLLCNRHGVKRAILASLRQCPYYKGAWIRD